MKVLIIHHESLITNELENLLVANEFSVYKLSNIEHLSNRLNNVQPDCLLLCPDKFDENISFYDLIPSLTDLPFIMFSHNATDDTIGYSLNAGAVDYLNLPLGPKEMSARLVKAIQQNDRRSASKILSFNDNQLKINIDSQEVFLNNTLLTLTKTEFAILLTLANTPSRIFSRGELMEAVRGLEFTGNDRAIDSHIKNLRLKLEVDTKQPMYILTIHGSGYRFGFK